MEFYSSLLDPQKDTYSRLTDILQNILRNNHLVYGLEKKENNDMDNEVVW